MITAHENGLKWLTRATGARQQAFQRHAVRRLVHRRPAYRAEYTPGAPARTGTTSPLSSPTTHSPSAGASVTALRVAFPSNVVAVSSTSGAAG